MFKELALILIDVAIMGLVAFGSAFIAIENGWDIFWITVPVSITGIRLLANRG